MQEAIKGALRPAYHKLRRIGFKAKREIRAVLRKEKIIVSLTSYPPRMQYVARSIQTVLDQSEKPDEVYLWLASGDFPNGLADLPEDVLLLRSKGLTIRFTDTDLKVHNKYFWTFAEHPNDIIVTVDDDILYRPDMISLLLKGYRLHPEAVSAIRAHRIGFDGQGGLLPYMEWQFEYMEELFAPRNDLLATGVGGVLYPPHVLDSELMTAENIRELCPNADDIWLKAVETLNRVPVCVCSDFVPTHVTVDGTQEVGLWHSNNGGGGNDRQIGAVLGALNEVNGSDDTLVSRMMA